VAGGSEAGWIETYKKPVIAPDGTILGTVGFARDISDRRRAEARAHEHAEQLNAIFDLSPDGFVSFDGARCVKYVSPAFCRLTGLGRRRLHRARRKRVCPAAGRALHPRSALCRP
jgi:PAS domain-containing protein